MYAHTKYMKKKNKNEFACSIFPRCIHAHLLIFACIRVYTSYFFIYAHVKVHV